jgi:hypothetical protein
MPKRGAKLFFKSDFLKVGSAIARSSFAHEEVLVNSELQTHMEFMSVLIFSCLCVSVFSFLGIRNFLSSINYLFFCHVISVYVYHILLLK